MGEGTLQPRIRASDREIAARKNRLSDLTRILLTFAFVFFLIGFGSVSAPLATGALLWVLALVMLVVALIVSAYNHFS